MQTISERLSLLRHLFRLQIGNSEAYEQPIMQNLDQVYQLIVADYATYRSNVAPLLDTLDCEGDESLSYTIKFFLDLLKYTTSQEPFKAFDESIVNEDLPEGISEVYYEVIRKNFQDNNQPRLSEFLTRFLPTDITTLRGLMNLTIEMMHHNADVVNWNKDQIDTAFMTILFGRGIAKQLDQLEIYYMAIGIFLERLVTSGQAQMARNICEECILAAYNDGVPEYGFYLSFKAYSVMSNVHGSLLYGSLCMTSLLGKQNINVKLIKQLHITALKFFRNIGLHNVLKTLYDEYGQAGFWTGYERRTNLHTYLSSQLGHVDPTLPEELLKVLSTEKDEILSGPEECMPWLTMLHNVKRLYPNADFTEQGLGFYFRKMSEIVPNESIQPLVNIIEGDAISLKDMLKAEILKLQNTNNKADFVFDNDMAIKIANRLLPTGDVEDFLVSMSLKSDYSLTFENKKSGDVIVAQVEDVDPQDFYTVLKDPKEQVKKITSAIGAELILLALSERDLYYLHYDGEYHQGKLESWEFGRFKQWRTDLPKKMLFDTTTKSRSGEVRTVYQEEFEQQGEAMRKQLDFIKLPVGNGLKPLFIIKDTELSRLPHNLLLNGDGKFIALDRPVVNIMSLDWQDKVMNEPGLPIDFSKSIWIPTDAQDFVIEQLYAKLEDCLVGENFTINQKSVIDVPLSSNIDIICSHGDRDISRYHSFFQNQDQYLHVSEDIVEKGEVLILFVCHSGSMQEDIFRNQIDSLIRHYFDLGFRAIIAPFWALHLYIPPIWLPAFLGQLKNGENIATAVFNANKQVHNQYPTPAAWACMHLYGNGMIKAAN
ncbi:hypothetical protein [Pedobacter agri]|uniref:hypothetical protein n=1 Tax=Pedobacter agri TaxID=454586 RepID=UPI00292FB595|nr:hypothetical protein [Pedobacter agri]